MGRRGVTASLVVAGLLGAGCGNAANELEGSLADVYPLDFASVGAQLVGDALVVEYLKAASAGKTLKMTIDLLGYTVSPGAEINLTETAAGGAPRGTLQRIVESTITLGMMNGGLTLDAVPTAGMALGGNFHASFSMPAGRSLHGSFHVEQVVKP